MLLSIEVLLFIFIFFITYKFFKIYKKKSLLPPGPLSLPFIGNIHQIGSAPIVAHSKFAKRYGEIHYVSQFGQPVVVINTLEAMKECNFVGSDDFSHRPIWMENFRTLILPPGIVGKGVEDYHENRRFLLSNLKRRGMGRSGLEPEILQEADHLISHLKSTSELDMRTALHGFSSNIVMTMCFGKRWDYGDLEYEVFSKAFHTCIDQSPLPILEDFLPHIFSFLPLFKKAKQEIHKSVAHIRKYFEDIIHDRIIDESPDEHDDIVSDYLKIHQVMDKEQLRNLVDICFDLFFAGSDTTSITTNFAIVHLINNPSWQEEIFAEIDTVLKGQIPSMEDLQNLPKIEATIQETIRMNPISPMILKANQHATKFRQYTIPSNTLVLINAYHINNDNETFPDPTTFNPRRWLSPEGKFRGDLVEKVPTFGVGRRACIGRPLARMEMFFMMVRLTQEFIFAVPDGHPIPSGALDVDTGAVTVNAPAYILKLIRREK